MSTIGPLISAGGVFDKFDKFEKLGLGGVALFGLAALLGWQIYASGTIWNEHDTKTKFDKDSEKYRADKTEHRFIMPTIILILSMMVVLSSSIIFRFFKGLMLMGMTRLLSVGILIGLLILNLNLRARYTGDLVPMDEDSARCPDGTILRKSAANNCQLQVSQCPNIKENIKLKSVWSWWEIPSLAIGGSFFLVGWLVYIVMTLKSKGKNL